MPEEILEQIADAVIDTENKIEVPTETDQVTEPDTEKTVQEAISKAESELARTLGWKPKEEFEGDAEDYVDAKTFILNQRAIGEHLKKHNKWLREEIGDLKKSIRMIRTLDEKKLQQEREKHKQELESAIRDAVAKGDVEEFEKLDKEIKGLDNENVVGVDEEKFENPIFTEWKEKNSWYMVDEDLSAIVDKYAANLRTTYPRMEFKELLDKVDEKMKKYLQKTETPPPPKPQGASPGLSAVEGTTSRPTSTGRKFTYKDLTPEQKKCCDDMVELEVMTKEKYIDDLVKIGELK